MAAALLSEPAGPMDLDKIRAKMMTEQARADRVSTSPPGGRPHPGDRRNRPVLGMDLISADANADAEGKAAGYNGVGAALSLTRGSRGVRLACRSAERPRSKAIVAAAAAELRPKTRGDVIADDRGGGAPLAAQQHQRLGTPDKVFRTGGKGWRSRRQQLACHAEALGMGQHLQTSLYTLPVASPAPEDLGAMPPRPRTPPSRPSSPGPQPQPRLQRAIVSATPSRPDQGCSPAGPAATPHGLRSAVSSATVARDVGLGVYLGPITSPMLAVKSPSPVQLTMSQPPPPQRQQQQPSDPGLSEAGGRAGAELTLIAVTAGRAMPSALACAWSRNAAESGESGGGGVAEPQPAERRRKAPSFVVRAGEEDTLDDGYGDTFNDDEAAVHLPGGGSDMEREVRHLARITSQDLPAAVLPQGIASPRSAVSSLRTATSLQPDAAGLRTVASRQLSSELTSPTTSPPRSASRLGDGRSTSRAIEGSGDGGISASGVGATGRRLSMMASTEAAEWDSAAAERTSYVALLDAADRTLSEGLPSARGRTPPASEKQAPHFARPVIFSGGSPPTRLPSRSFAGNASILRRSSVAGSSGLLAFTSIVQRAELPPGTAFSDIPDDDEDGGRPSSAAHTPSGSGHASSSGGGQSPQRTSGSAFNLAGSISIKQLNLLDSVASAVPPEAITGHNTADLPDASASRPVERRSEFGIFGMGANSGKSRMQSRAIRSGDPAARALKTGFSRMNPQQQQQSVSGAQGSDLMGRSVSVSAPTQQQATAVLPEAASETKTPAATAMPGAAKTPLETHMAAQLEVDNSFGPWLKS